MCTFHHKFNPFSLYCLVKGSTLCKRMQFALFSFYVILFNFYLKEQYLSVKNLAHSRINVQFKTH